MDLDEAADELYAISPDDFVARRKELSAAARQTGDREVAKAITALRRPTRSAWLVNVLARRTAEAVAQLLELGAALADAQQRRSGDDLRRLSQQRRTQVDALAREAVRLGQDLGYTAPDGALQEVAQTLQAALGDPEVAELLRRGLLTQATTYGGFGPSDLTAALAASMPPAAVAAVASEGPAPAPAAAAAEPSTEPTPDPEEERRRELRRAAAEADAERDRTRAELQRADAEAQPATEHADELAEAVEELRTRLAEAEQAEREGRDQARQLRRRLVGLRQAADAAEQAAARTMHDLG